MRRPRRRRRARRSSDGAQTLRVRGVDVRNNADPTPEPLSFTVDTTAPPLKIRGKRLRLGPRGIKLKLRCAAAELTGPCQGRLRLKTRKRVRFGGKKRKVTLARTLFRLDPGSKSRTPVPISKRKRELLKQSNRARKVRAKGEVHDALGNQAPVGKRLKIRG